MHPRRQLGWVRRARIQTQREDILRSRDSQGEVIIYQLRFRSDWGGGRTSHQLNVSASNSTRICHAQPQFLKLRRLPAASLL